MVKLQVALDILDLTKAINIAKECVDVGFDIVEVGTPLLKKFGIHTTVKEFRRILRNNVIIFVDTKTMDAASIEASIVKESGGDIMSVMALASEDTIIEAYNACRKLNLKLLIDLMNVQEPLKMAENIMNLGVKPDIFCLHVGIDVQKRRGVNVDFLIKLVTEMRECLPKDVEVAVAGGINELTALLYANAGANIIIIGGAITKANNPKIIAQRIVSKVKGTS